MTEYLLDLRCLLVTMENSCGGLQVETMTGEDLSAGALAKFFPCDFSLGIPHPGSKWIPLRTKGFMESYSTRCLLQKGLKRFKTIFYDLRQEGQIA